MLQRQESDSPLPCFQCRSHWLPGGQGEGRAGGWKSDPGGAGLLGGESCHFPIIDNRQPFLPSWRQTLDDWLLFCFGPKVTPSLSLSLSLSLCPERCRIREGKQGRSELSEQSQNLNPRTHLCSWVQTPPISYLICGMVELRTRSPAALC